MVGKDILLRLDRNSLSFCCFSVYTYKIIHDGGTGSPGGAPHGLTGSFNVQPTDKVGRDHRGKGRLTYVGEHHLQFAETGEWFLKGGVDSPENVSSAPAQHRRINRL
jgi:hypothetical protein